MGTLSQHADFEALDACHQQVMAHLKDLDTLAGQLEQNALDAQSKGRASAIDAFFSGTSRQHHADEEKSVFPMLLESDDTRLVAAVQTLQQDHGWIERNWVELSPRLRTIASGMTPPEPTAFRRQVDVFVALYRDHIALEETLFYPESKAHWAAVVANRVERPAP